MADNSLPPERFWKGLIGESVSEGYEGMRAAAHVYKNRLDAGIPLGMVALNRKDLDSFVAKQGPKYSQMAQEIVQKVFYGNDEDNTSGATHYENIEAFGVPSWAKDMEVTTKIGRHTFYKRKSDGYAMVKSAMKQMRTTNAK